MPTYAEKVVALLADGFTIGQRDSRINRNYGGTFMVVEAYDDAELPTDDGRNGPWCIVGYDLNALVSEAFEFMLSLHVKD